MWLPVSDWFYIKVAQHMHTMTTTTTIHFLKKSRGSMVTITLRHFHVLFYNIFFFIVQFVKNYTFIFIFKCPCNSCEFGPAPYPDHALETPVIDTPSLPCRALIHVHSCALVLWTRAAADHRYQHEMCPSHAAI